MKTVISATAIRLLIPLFFAFSLYVLFRGHNNPGGGFIGGLIGSIAFVFHAMTHGEHATRKVFLVIPVYRNIRKRTPRGWLLIRKLVGSVYYIFTPRPQKDETEYERLLIPINPSYLIATGLLLALLSGIPAVLHDLPFMSAYWIDNIYIPIINKPGTPLLFDSGVYVLVIGIVIKITLVMAEE